MRVMNERSRIKDIIRNKLALLGRLDEIVGDDYKTWVALTNLDPDTATKDQVIAIVGAEYSSWTYWCHECGGKSDEQRVHFGDHSGSGYEGASVCKTCIQAALAAIS